MKKLVFLFITLGVFFLAGCEDNPAMPEEGLATIHFIVENLQGSGMEYQVGDAVAIIDTIGIRKFVVEKVNGNKVEITGEAEISTNNWRMVYPYSDSIRVETGAVSLYIQP